MTIFAENEITAEWRAYLETLECPGITVTLPTGDELVRTLRYLEIPEEDIPDVVALAPSPLETPELWWYLERAVWSLVSYMGKVEQPPKFAPLRDINDPDYRYFYVHVFTATLPHVRAYHQEIGIPEEIAQATLADLGRNVRVHRKREGIGGLGVAWWLMLHFRGVIYQLGRLQFERARLWESIAGSIRAAGDDVDEMTPMLSVHIPDFSGPMSPEACDDSFARAREFFPTYFPEDHVRYAACSSWLLDPQLKDYLSPESNIIRYQNRFVLGDNFKWESNMGVMQFVFGKTPADIDTVPQETSLQRAVVAHLRAGGTWYGRAGWFRLDDIDAEHQEQMAARS
jgi:hypothetical protein